MLNVKSYISTFVYVISIALIFNANAASSVKKQEASMLKLDIAKTFFQKGRLIESMQNLQSAIKLDSKNFEAQHLYGLILFNKSEFLKAKKHLKKAIRFKKNYSDAYNNLCALNIQLSEYSQAQSNCHKALSNVLYATPERAYYNLGKLKEIQGDINQAQAYLQQSLQSNENFVLSLNKLAEIEIKQKKWTWAQSRLEKGRKICSLSQDSAETKNQWGDVCAYVSYNLSTMDSTKKIKKKSLLQDCLELSSKNSKIHLKCRQSISALKF